MINKRKIMVVTSCRADYWLLKELITLLHTSNECELQLCVIAGHLSPFHGHTVEFIKRDGFPISAQIESLLASDNSVGLIKTMALTQLGAAEYLSTLKPDLVVVLGDRYEIMAFATAAYSMKIPLCHIHGGEKTSGALDDAYRHIITKLSALHFTTHIEYANRVKQLGENPENIYVVGAPCIDQIAYLEEVSRTAILEKLNLTPYAKYVLLGYHPTTLADSSDDIEAITTAVDVILKNTDYYIVATRANSDPAGQKLNHTLEQFAHNVRVRLFDTLGGAFYYNAIKYCEFVIGNSSSGIIEVPYFKKATINIGTRQAGRIAPTSVINTNKNDFHSAFTKTMDKEWSKVNVETAQMIYGAIGKVAIKIYEVLLAVKLDCLINKDFRDL